MAGAGNEVEAELDLLDLGRQGGVEPQRLNAGGYAGPAQVAGSQIGQVGGSSSDGRPVDYFFWSTSS